MIGIVLCLLAFAASWIAARRSLVSGLIAVLAVGYGYGIVRSNWNQTATYFLFDAALVGFYPSALLRSLTPIQRRKIESLTPWLLALIGLPTLLLFVPEQPFLVRLVGWRAATFFLPCLLIGAMLEPEQMDTLALALAALNLVALGFALLEMVFGVDRFYPLNAATILIYSSSVGDAGALRIPGTFSSSGAYGVTLLATLPLLVGAWAQPRKPSWQRSLLIAGIAAAVLGVFMCASRSNALILIGLALILVVSGKLEVKNWIMWLGLAVAIGWVVVRQPLMQRVFTVRSHTVVQRVGWSVNQNLFETVEKYPLGNGLGGGGTNLPYFLQGEIVNPVHLENEYATLALEQGLPGLFLWLAFIGWIFTRGGPHPLERWYLGRWLARLTIATWLAGGVIGTGMLNDIPATVISLAEVGWIVAPQILKPTDLAEVPSEISGQQFAAPGRWT